jgi:hypothetical protein
MSKVRELCALLEILDTCYADLNELLMCDHPPPDMTELIAKERQTIHDVEYLIADVKAEIACKELHKYLMNEYAITSQMNRLSV